MYVDAHCHLADKRFGEDLSAVMKRARSSGIRAFVQGGVDPGDWQRQLALRCRDWVLAFGLHPWFVAQNEEKRCAEALTQLHRHIEHASALGELGLDFHHKFPPECFDRQRRFFRDQLDLASGLGLPLVLHLVQAHAEALPLLATQAPWRGIVHGFTAGPEVARCYLDLGLLISVGGAVTRPGYRKLKRTVRDLPLEALVVESDAPDMAPPGFHGLNEPNSIWTTAEAIAQLKDITATRVLAQSAKNLAGVLPLEGLL